MKLEIGTSYEIGDFRILLEEDNRLKIFDKSKNAYLLIHPVSDNYIIVKSEGSVKKCTDNFEIKKVFIWNDAEIQKKEL